MKGLATLSAVDNRDATSGALAGGLGPSPKSSRTRHVTGDAVPQVQIADCLADKSKLRGKPPVISLGKGEYALGEHGLPFPAVDN